jgi:hypothetical protein
MAESEGSTTEAIGRPGPWKEGRYQQPGQSVDQSVVTPAGTSLNPDKRVSTPVTRQDYELPKLDSTESGGKSEPPGGDAG